MQIRKTGVHIMHRRAFLGSALAGVAAASATGAAAFELPPRFQAQIVPIRGGWTPGDIHVDPNVHHLYLILSGDQAIRYGIAVGRGDLYESGVFTVGAKKEWPSWTPTQNMIEREPHKYAQYEEGMPGGPNNPLGARALYLFEGTRDTFLRLHGTPQPWTIGRSVSSGCVRLPNEQVMDLYERVPLGTRVVLH
jgi:lipoprotein-anchoring transpeptidase ErfK/SrfK